MVGGERGKRPEIRINRAPGAWPGATVLMQGKRDAADRDVSWQWG